MLVFVGFVFTVIVAVVLVVVLCDGVVVGSDDQRKRRRNKCKRRKVHIGAKNVEKIKYLNKWIEKQNK